jgi:NDP-sugar pyrophosphorylase family protein
MKAFLLAAGLGSRLRPLTDRIPKALIPVLSVPMLDRLAAALARSGVTEFALNTHHLAKVVEAHLQVRTEQGTFAHLPGVPVHLFHEMTLLGTGGGLLQAARYWGDEPLLVWNADILADLAPGALLAAHPTVPDIWATLAVSRRASSSYLLFDEGGQLCGISSPRRRDHRVVRPPQGSLQERAFHGISMLAPEIRKFMERRHPSGTVFDLIDELLAATAEGATVLSHETGESYWGSTGTPAELAILEQGLRERPELLARWTP